MDGLDRLQKDLRDDLTDELSEEVPREQHSEEIQAETAKLIDVKRELLNGAKEINRRARDLRRERIINSSDIEKVEIEQDALALMRANLAADAVALNQPVEDSDEEEFIRMEHERLAEEMMEIQRQSQEALLARVGVLSRSIELDLEGQAIEKMEVDESMLAAEMYEKRNELKKRILKEAIERATKESKEKMEVDIAKAKRASNQRLKDPKGMKGKENKGTKEEKKDKDKDKTEEKKEK